MKIDVSDLLLGVCALALVAAGFAVALWLGLVVLGVFAGLLAVATQDQPLTVRFPKVRLPWRS